jgi:hypothetical protein
MLGEFEPAIALIERAMREGGPKADLHFDLIAVRQQQRAAGSSRR